MKNKILVIEDEKDLRYFLSMALKEEGFEVEEAFDAEEALEKLKQKKVDLILLDLLLPRMSGFEFLTKIKKESTFSSIPVIILSNLGQREEIEEGLRRGAVDYLIKANFTLDEIIKKVKDFLKS